MPAPRLLLVVFTAATALAQAPQQPLELWVLAPTGPVSGADIRGAMLDAQPCPCPARRRTVEQEPGNGVPECACPKALRWYQQRLASCDAAPAMKALGRSGPDGRSVLDAAMGLSLEVSTQRSLQWVTLPAGGGPMTIELAPPVTRRLRLDPPVEARAALLFEDGHCVPFRREGASSVWATVTPAPASDEWPVLVVEADGYASIVRAWFESEPELPLSLHPSRIADTCDGDRVELDNPFQHLVTRVGPRGQFSFSGVLELDSTVRCFRGKKLQARWIASPADPEPGAIMEGGFPEPPCHDVVVVDGKGRPVAGASVLGVPESPGQVQGDTTDALGKACVEDLVAGTDLQVSAAPELGGTCAGNTSLRVTRAMLTRPIRVSLDVRPLPRSPVRGRVVSPEQAPVVGAVISVDPVVPAQGGCEAGWDGSAVTGLDGRFELPPLPHGTATLIVQHDWYTKRSFQLTLPGAERDFPLERGTTWTGRVLDPEGRVLDACELFLTLPDGRLLRSACSAAGFSFATLGPGAARLKVRVERHPLGTFRTLEQTVVLGAASSTVDVRWPRGEPIGGQVVDESGAPVPGARLTALPKGTLPLSDRFAPHEVMLEADAQGRFLFRHLAPGDWTLRGDLRGGQLSTLDVHTGEAGLRFVVRPAR